MSGITVRLPRRCRGKPWDIWVSDGDGRDFVYWHRRTTDAEAYFGDLPPSGYRISANDSSGQGGYHEKFGGHDYLSVRADEHETVKVDVEKGYRVTGRVLHAGARAAIEGAYVRVARYAGTRFPVALASFWTVSDADGNFTLGGLRGSQKIKIDIDGFKDGALEVSGESLDNEILLVERA